MDRVNDHPLTPEGWHTVTPRIVAQGARQLVEFMVGVFGAVGEFQESRPSIVWIGDSPVMVSEAGSRPAMPVFLYVYVKDTDTTYRRAMKAGARTIEEPSDTPYGDRRCMIADKWGNTWQIATYSDANPRRRGKEADMQRVVRAFPILPGKELALQELVSQLAGERAKEAAEFFGRFGVTHESWHAQETPAGTWVIGVTEISDIPVEVAAEGYARSEQPFDSWFKEQVRGITGIDPNTTPLGPPTQCIFNWQR